ncbi:MAG: hypothetical protein U0X92_15315 [Anaerolineales bacterium]
MNHALETVEIADLASRQIGQLSAGGQQQRMFIARAPRAIRTDVDG